jgi:hypothetical protein
LFGPGRLVVRVDKDVGVYELPVASSGAHGARLESR